MPETPPADPIGTRIWDALVAPAPGISDPGEHDRLRVIAAIAWPLAAFALLEVLTAPVGGRLVGLFVVTLIIASYALARTGWARMASALLVLSTAVVPYYGMSTPEPTTRPMAELAWALLLPMVAASVLEIGWVLPIGWGHVMGLGLIALNNPEIPASAAWQLIGTLSIVTLFAVVGSWSRDMQQGTLHEREQHLSSALGDLARARALAESTIASMADGLLVADGSRRIRSANPALCRALGYREAELLGQPLDFVLVDDNADTQIFEAPLGAGESMLSQESLEARFRTRGGDEIPMSCKVTWLEGPGPVEFGLVVLARDMRAVVRTIQARAEADAHRRKAAEIKDAHDQLLQTQAQLVQAGKLAALGELAGAVAHEVNNPLAAALLATDLAEEAVDEGMDIALVRSQLAVVHQAIERCRHVIKGLLEFGRQSSGTRERVDLQQVVDSALTLIARKLEASGSTVEVDIPEALPVWGDRNQLGQVVLNLLMNASQAGAGTAIEIGGSRALGEVRLSIRDHGKGIDPRVRGRIFEPFFTTKPRGQGTGLGLSISYGIVTDHGGQILVESELREGSTFTVVLPEVREVHE